MPSRLEIRTKVVSGPEWLGRRGQLEQGALGALGGFVLRNGFVLSVALVLAAHECGARSAWLLLGPAVLLVGTVYFLLLANRASLRVGADGLFLRRFLRSRFLPYSGIEGVVRDSRSLVVDEKGRPPLVLEFPKRRGFARRAVSDEVSQDDDPLEALLTRIERARSAYGRCTVERPFEAVVGRARAGTSEWIAALRASTRRQAFRLPSVTTETLWSLVEDASKPPIERVAAAIALRSDLAAAGDHDVASRLRIAVEATAAPRLRVALEAALDEDDQRLERSVTKLARSP